MRVEPGFRFEAPLVSAYGCQCKNDDIVMPLSVQTAVVEVVSFVACMNVRGSDDIGIRH